MSRFSIAACLGTIVLAGCGSGPKLVEVDGTLKVGGQPLEKIRVEFWPEGNGPRSNGLTDAEGKFKLTSDDGKPGVFPGKHKVVLRDEGIIVNKTIGRAAEDLDLTEGRQPRIANLYGDALKSPLTAEVAAGKPVVLEAQPFAGGGGGLGRGAER